MQIKRILAKDARSAHEQAVALYGRDALVISTSKVDGRTELIVAVEEPTSAPPTVAPAAAPVHPSAAAKPSDSPPEDSSTVAAFESALGAMMKRQARPAPRPAPTPAPGAIAAHPATRRPPADAAAVAPESELRARELVDLIRREIAQLRSELLSERHDARAIPPAGVCAQVRELMGAIGDCGLPPVLLGRLTGAMQKAGDREEALVLLRESLTRGLPARIDGAIDWSGAHALLGPSGAGKTLMAARLARRLAGSGGEHSVAWISFRDRRPGAWSQAQTLAARIGVELFRAADEEALRLLIDELGDRTTLLIDTGGEDWLVNARTLARACPAVRRHALVPADAAPAKLHRLLEAGDPAWDGLLFSRLDEAIDTWPLIIALIDKPLPPVRGIARSGRPDSEIGRFEPADLIECALQKLVISDSTIAGSPSFGSILPFVPRAVHA